LPQVDLPDDVRGAEAGDDERRRDADGPLLHSDNLGIGRREAYALGCTIRPAVSLLARLGRRQHRFAVGQEADAGRLGTPTRAEAALRDRLAEGTGEREGVEVDPERGAAELGLAWTDARVEVEHLRAVRVEPNAGDAWAFLDAERGRRGLGELGREGGLLALPELALLDPVGSCERAKDALAGERGHGHDRLLDDLLDEAEPEPRRPQRGLERGTELARGADQRAGALSRTVGRAYETGVADDLVRLGDDLPAGLGNV